MKALDLFCGLGGWSDGLAAEGFDVTGVEIEPKIAALYKHRVIVSDVCDLNPEDFKGYDLIVGSPPCRDFCIIAKTLGHRWERPPDPAGEGMRLVNTFLNFVEVAKPRYWLMENSSLAKQYIPLKPRQETSLSKGMRRCFYGNYPLFLSPRDMTKKIWHLKPSIKGTGLKHVEAWEKARIPLPIARALAQSVRTQLASKSVEETK